MRAYVRSWINEWDLKRAYPDYDVSTEFTPLPQDYPEDRDLETSEPDDQTGGPPGED